MASRPGIVRTTKALCTRIKTWRDAGDRIALVPTMGALHGGHLSLVERAKAHADRVVASIFVNPKQFGPNEDLEAYPRDEKADLAKLAKAGTDLAYLPSVDEIYPAGFATTIHVDGLTERLCGASRPGHFDSVTTIVAKLFLQVAPDIAVFGEKDYQQLVVLKRMVQDLDMPLKIIGAPIKRESDGLALSSRNAYLSPLEREIAPLLHRSLHDLASDLAEGRTIDDAIAAARHRLEQADFRLDYLEVADPKTLIPLHGVLARPARIFVAAFLGTTRLIDNLGVRPKAKLARAKA